MQLLKTHGWHFRGIYWLFVLHLVGQRSTISGQYGDSVEGDLMLIEPQFTDNKTHSHVAWMQPLADLA